MLTEFGLLSVSAREAFKVIYSPFEAFKEIIQNPKYIGPLLIMILAIAANAGDAYALASKTNIEQTIPVASQLDEWTENATIWISSANITLSDDHINGTYYGNKSLQFTAVNSDLIWMQLDLSKSIDLTEYNNVSFRIKEIVQPDIVELKNVSLRLFSHQTEYFYYNITGYFVPFVKTAWNNLTISVGPRSTWQSKSANADWNNITGLKFEFGWSENANLTVRLEGLFFRGLFISALNSLSGYLVNFSLVGFMQFTIRWVLLSGILFFMSKAFRAKTVWRTLLILVGFALITLFLQALINALVYVNLPVLYYRFEFIGGVKGESEVAYNAILQETALVSQIVGYVQIAMYVWTIGLCAIALRTLSESSWTTSVIVAAVGFVVTLLIEGLILGY